MKNKSGFSRFLTVRWLLIIVFAVLACYSTTVIGNDLYIRTSAKVFDYLVLGRLLSVVLLLAIAILVEQTTTAPLLILSIAELVLLIVISYFDYPSVWSYFSILHGILLLIYILYSGKNKSSYRIVWPIIAIVISALHEYLRCLNYNPDIFVGRGIYFMSFSHHVLFMLILCHGISIKQLFGSIHTKTIKEKPMNITTTPSQAATKSKVTAALLAFFVGGIGGHRYYLGYIEKGIMQTCGCIAVVVGYMTIFSNMILSTVLLLAGVGCYIWVFIDFIRILTGSLAPADGSVYKENLAPQPQIVQTTAKPSEYAATLEKLASLHKQGILSDEEFQQKKAELLEKI